MVAIYDGSALHLHLTTLLLSWLCEHRRCNSRASPTSWRKLSCLLNCLSTLSTLYHVNTETGFVSLTCYLCNYQVCFKLFRIALHRSPACIPHNVNPQKNISFRGKLACFSMQAHFRLLLGCYVCDMCISTVTLSLNLQRWFMLSYLHDASFFILDQAQGKRLPFSGIIPYAQAPKGLHMFWFFCRLKHPFPNGFAVRGPCWRNYLASRLTRKRFDYRPAILCKLHYEQKKQQHLESVYLCQGPAFICVGHLLQRPNIHIWIH